MPESLEEMPFHGSVGAADIPKAPLFIPNTSSSCLEEDSLLTQRPIIPGGART